MTVKPKKKLCWNCDGRVSAQEENCPYCGVYLSPMALSGNSDQNSLFAPPYRMDSSEEEPEIPAAPYSPPPQENKESAPEPTAPAISLFDKNPRQTMLLSLLLLSTGSLFLIFGFILLLFSVNGRLTLSWNGDSWYLFLVLSLPLLGFGWQALNHIKEKN